MRNRTIRILYLLIIFSILTGCSFPGVATPQDPSEAYTQAAGTIMTTLTLGAFINQASSTPLPPIVITATPEIPTQTATVENTPIIVPIETQNPVATRTPSSGNPTISANVDTNCRSGPGPVYPMITGLFVGQSSVVMGRNNAGTWWYIQNPLTSTKYCWVWANTTRVEGDTSNLPIIAAPPTPTPEQPTISLSSSAAETNYTGACPIDITLRGTIVTDMPTEVRFRWTADFPHTFDYVDYTFKKAEDETWFQTMTINADTNGYIRFKLYEPFTLSDDKIHIVVDCVP